MREWLRRVPRGAYATLALAQATLLTVLSHVPGQKLPSQGWLASWLFNFAHAPMFFVLAALVAGALAARDRGVAAALPPARLGVSGLLVFAFAVFDEWHQSLVAQRASDGVDVVTDCAGIAAALVVAHTIVSAPARMASGPVVVRVGICALIGISSAAVAARAV
jgi:VanZ family protein